MNFQERLIQFISSTQLWADLDDNQRANVGNIIRWARSLGHDGAEWVARILQRFCIVMSEDKPGSDKWARRTKEILAEYDEARIVRDFFFFAKPDNQFKVVYARYAEIAKTNQVIARALEDLRYKDGNGKDIAVDKVYDELNSVGEKISKLEKLPQGKPLVQFPDGTKWVELDSHGCEEEGAIMKHCGNIGGRSGDHMLSLRQPSNTVKGFFEPRLTFIWNPKTKALGEMKGKANTKPADEYHKYIVGLLNSGKVSKLTGGGYRVEVNFSLNDLNDADFAEVVRGNPDLVRAALTAGDKYQKLDKHHRDMYEQLQGEALPPPAQDDGIEAENTDEDEA